MIHGRTFPLGMLGAIDLASNVVILDSEDRVLAVTRPENSNYWCLPGGKREGGETSAETALRELAEETSLRARTLLPVFSAPSFTESLRVVTTFLCTADGDPKPLEGGQVNYLAKASLCNPMVSPFYRYYRLLFQAIRDLP